MKQITKETFALILFFLMSGQLISQSVRLVEDINPDGSGVTRTDEKYFAAVGDNLFFVANNSISGNELWITDGFTGSTRMVLDIFPGEESSDLHGLIEHNGLCYFFADDGVNGKELWSSDGTEAGTQMVADLNEGSSSSLFSSFEYLTSYGGSLYFEAFDGDKDQFWVVDANGDARIFSGLPTANFNTSITGLHVMNDDLYFFRRVTFEGLTLYKFDGSVITTIEEFGLGNIITHIDNSEGVLFYAIQDGFSDIIWSYDSNTGTNTRHNTSSTVHSMIAYDSKLYYSIDDDASLYLIESPSVEPTVLSETSSSFADEPTAFEIFNDLVYFFGETSNDGVHRTDGTPEGTELIFDINQVTFDRDGIHSIGDQLLIAGESSFMQGEELFISDGEATIDIFSDINPGNRDSSPTGFIDVGDGRTFFTATTEEEGRELWMYSTSSLSTLELSSNLYTVYPTLVTNSLSINYKSEGSLSSTNISIINNQGMSVVSGDLTSLSNIDTTGWDAGVYYINIAAGGNMETHKVIKL